MGISWSVFLGQLGLGLPMALAAVGSVLGISAAGRAAAGAWSKESREGKALSFTYIILAGMPLSQTIYAFIFQEVGLKLKIIGDAALTGSHAGTLLGLGLACGLAELASAWGQGLVGGAACRALSEGGGKGFVFMIITMGIVETVGLFGFVFLLLMLP